MKNYEAELYMMNAELAEQFSEDFPVKSNNRAERRKAEARMNNRRYGKARPSREERKAYTEICREKREYRLYYEGLLFWDYAHGYRGRREAAKLADA